MRPIFFAQSPQFHIWDRDTEICSHFTCRRAFPFPYAAFTMSAPINSSVSIPFNSSYHQSEVFSCSVYFFHFNLLLHRIRIARRCRAESRKTCRILYLLYTYVWKTIDDARVMTINTRECVNDWCPNTILCTHHLFCMHIHQRTVNDSGCFAVDCSRRVLLMESTLKRTSLISPCL